MTIEGMARWLVALGLVFLLANAVQGLGEVPRMPLMETATSDAPGVEEWRAWQAFHAGPLVDFAGRVLTATLLLLAVVFVLRGRIRIEGGRMGIRVRRFGFLDRFAYWLTALSFALVVVGWFAGAVGEGALVPALDRLTEGEGARLFEELTLTGGWLHAHVLWSFLLGLVLLVVIRGVRCLPMPTDALWFLKGGSVIPTRSTPSARKFTGGQKLLFWLFVLLGALAVATGLSMTAIGTLPAFEPVREGLVAAGSALGVVPEAPTAFQTWQFMRTAHTLALVALSMLALVHVYFVTVGKEGSFAALWSGRVDLAWARQHHDLWAARIDDADQASLRSAPAGSRRPAGASSAYTGVMPMRAPTKPS